MADQAEFKVITHDRDAQNREKAVDTELVAQGTLLLATTPSPAALVIASGDRDFLPLVSVAHQLNWTVGVSSEGHAVMSVKVRPEPKNSGSEAREALWRESKTAEPSDNILERSMREASGCNVP